ncbi:hypothetical protein VLK31_20845 [Variovorax sp. H27-G14]|uniref:hypothetical protein n=1 Tax=Variovorax sp. H27-G14 TaxID=3111914 RepID=UPI0038FCAE25
MNAPIRTTLVFTADLAVFYKAALQHAAMARALEDGLSEAEWASMRVGLSDDLVMLLDPGLMVGAGFEILQSACGESAQ